MADNDKKLADLDNLEVKPLSDQDLDAVAGGLDGDEQRGRLLRPVLLQRHRRRNPDHAVVLSARDRTESAPLRQRSGRGSLVFLAGWPPAGFYGTVTSCRQPVDWFSGAMRSSGFT